MSFSTWFLNKLSLTLKEFDRVFRREETDIVLWSRCTDVLVCTVAVQTVLFIHRQLPPDVFRESLLVSDSMSSRVFLGYRLVVVLLLLLPLLLLLLNRFIALSILSWTNRMSRYQKGKMNPVGISWSKRQ